MICFQCQQNALPVTESESTLGRRAALGKTLLAASCGVVGWSASFSPASGFTNTVVDDLSPRLALDKLYEGNRRFAAGMPLAENRDMTRVRELAEGQRPFAAFLGCADSRVPIEIVFDQGFGDLFVTRIAGNVASSENIGSLEFGTQVLGARVLYVLGHTECGAVRATMQGNEVPGQISGLFQHIRPAVRTAGGDVNLAVKNNVQNQARLLAEASPVISRLVRQGDLIIAGGVYDLKTGIVSAIDVEV